MQASVRWREVLLFSLIAYALTWCWSAIWILPRLDLLRGANTPADPTTIYGNLLNFLPGMFGPLIAAVMMRLWVSGEGLRGSLGLRRSWRQYAAALVVPIVFVAVVGGLILLTGWGHLKSPAEPLTIAIAPLLAMLLFLELLAGFGEEYGWRGYLLPRLLPLGEVRATLVLGLVWWPWHLPVLITGVVLGGNSLWLILPIHLCAVLFGSFPYTWLARASGFSPAVTAVFHGSSNWAGQRLLTFLALSSALVGVAALGLAWLIVVLAWYSVRWFRERQLPSNASRGMAMRWATGAPLLLVAIVAACALWLWIDFRVQPLPSAAAVTTIVEERLAAGFGTAMVVGISDGGVRRFIARGDGVSGPASADTPFEIASITKVLTSSLLAVMAESGDLSFDDAAASLWRATPPRLPDDGSKPVTLGELAAHIAGLPKMPDDLVSTDVRDPEAGYTAERLDAFLARYDAPSPPFGYRYSNVGFAVLGQGLGERSGRSYGDLLRVRITEPLGMIATGLAGSAGTPSPVIGHDDQMATTPPFSAGVFSPAGGAVSTASDLLAFAEGYLGYGDPVVVKAFARAAGFSVTEAITGKPLGLGWDLSKIGRRTILTKDGSAAGYNAFVAIDREAKRAVVILANGQGAVSDVALNILDARMPVRHLAPTIAIDASTIEPNVGTYEGKDTGPVVFTRVEDRLYFQFGELPAPIRLFPESPTRFVAHAFDAAVTFQPPVGGVVTDLVAVVEGSEVLLTRKR